MTKLEIEKSNRGGYRKRLKLTHATQRLLKVLWERFGGLRELERKTGIAAQKFVHWRNTGKVSFKSIGKVSRILDLPLPALNFEEIAEVLGRDVFQWNELLTELEVSHEERMYINKGRLPKIYKAKEDGEE